MIKGFVIIQMDENLREHAIVHEKPYNKRSNTNVIN